MEIFDKAKYDAAIYAMQEKVRKIKELCEELNAEGISVEMRIDQSSLESWTTKILNECTPAIA